MAKTKAKQPELSPLTMAERLRVVLGAAEARLIKLQAEYDYSRRSFAAELTDGEGPTWISSSSETEWRRLRTELWQTRDIVKGLRFIAEATS